MISRALSALILSAAAASAQDIVFSQAATEACLAAAEGDLSQMRACIGTSANACMADTQGGETTVGMGGCLDAEWQYWDGRLNAVYQREIKNSKMIDAETAELGMTVPSQLDALRDMQRAWIPFRDAKCRYEYSQWGGGTGGGPASIACMLVETGEQALFLEFSRTYQ